MHSTSLEMSSSRSSLLLLHRNEENQLLTLQSSRHLRMVSEDKLAQVIRPVDTWRSVLAKGP